MSPTYSVHSSVGCQFDVPPIVSSTTSLQYTHVAHNNTPVLKYLAAWVPSSNSFLTEKRERREKLRKKRLWEERQESITNEEQKRGKKWKEEKDGTTERQREREREREGWVAEDIWRRRRQRRYQVS
jgi:hypothetical protein